METSEKNNSNAGKALGIAGLISGILAAVVSFIPCLGVYAVFPGIIGLVLSIISMVQASKANAAKGLAIAGLVCSLVGSSIAVYQYFAIKSGVEKFGKELDKINKEYNTNE